MIHDFTEHYKPKTLACKNCGRKVTGLTAYRRANGKTCRPVKYPVSVLPGLTARRVRKFRRAEAVAKYINEYPSGDVWARYLSGGFVSDEGFSRKSPYRLLERRTNPDRVGWRTMDEYDELRGMFA